MQKRKIVCKLFLLLIIVCSLTGCWDKEELEDNAYVIGLGIDHSKHEGNIKVTMLIANPEVGSVQGGGGSIEKAREIISFDAIDFITAKATANAVISRDISYDLLKIIVVSEEFAKDPKFLPLMYDTLRDKEIRMDCYLAISKEKASEYFIKNTPKMETRPHKYFQFMIDHGIENGLIPDSTLFRFFKTMDQDRALFLAMYTSAEREKNPPIREEDNYEAGQLNASGELDETQFIGSAVFKNGVMIEKLTGAETREVNVLDDTTNIGDILNTVPDPFSDEQAQMAIRILKTENNTVKMNLKGERPKIYITVPLKIEIMTNPSMTNFVKSKKNRKILKDHLTKVGTTRYEELLKKTQTELKGVPYPLSIYARKYFKTIQEFERYNWPKEYVEADISVKVNIEITDYNIQKRPPKRTEE